MRRIRKPRAWSAPVFNPPLQHRARPGPVSKIVTRQISHIRFPSGDLHTGKIAFSGLNCRFYLEDFVLGCRVIVLLKRFACGPVIGSSAQIPAPIQGGDLTTSAPTRQPSEVAPCHHISTSYFTNLRIFTPIYTYFHLTSECHAVPPAIMEDRHPAPIPKT
jgi:hypothetical protein